MVIFDSGLRFGPSYRLWYGYGYGRYWGGKAVRMGVE